ncbi:MAG: flagellar motor protein [Burkholderiales bacterium]|nr:flagellar motor protein [Burkholderiales bacterium]
MVNMTWLGLGVAFVAILCGQVLEGTSLALLVQPTALLIVGGGTLGAMLVQSSAADFRTALAMLRWLREPPLAGKDHQVREIVGWARLAYKEGALKLDGLCTSIQDPWLRNGVEMVVDRFDPEYIRQTLLMELRLRDAQMRRAVKVWESAAGYAPTIGILGSVLGLLRVMSTMQDAAAVGSGLAVAFVATFYGLSLANLVFLPVAHKLKVHVFEQTLRDEMRVEGLVMIAEHRQPWLVEKTLASFGAVTSNVVPLKAAA